MKNLLRLLVVFAGCAALAGCANVDLTPEGNPDRVVEGSVAVNTTLQPGTQVLVRVLDRSPRDLPNAAQNDLPIADRPRPVIGERVLGEQMITLSQGTTQPVPFRVEYHADDATLRRGLNIEARVSINGTVRYRTINQHVLTLASAPYKHDVTVSAVQ